MAKGKTGLLAILGPPKGEAEGGEGDGEETEDEAMAMKTAAMEDFLAASKAEDPKAMASAFKRAYDACHHASEAESEEY